MDHPWQILIKTKHMDSGQFNLRSIQRRNWPLDVTTNLMSALDIVDAHVSGAICTQQRFVRIMTSTQQLQSWGLLLERLERACVLK